MTTIALRPEEIRVLGVLIEKSLSQPAYYPMTVNAITNAANQKTNRDPVTDYSESVISGALSSLRRRDLAGEADADRGSRAVKFRHRAEERYGWNAAQRAIMAELMLRGPQTLAELRSRASRMTHLDSQDYARDLLAELERTDPPLVRELDREPGKSARRFGQLLGGEISPERAATSTVDSVAPTVITRQPELLGGRTELEERVERLEATVAELREDLDRLRGG